MSLYNDPGNFQDFKQDLSSDVQSMVGSTAADQPIKDFQSIQSNLAFLARTDNYKHLKYLRVTDTHLDVNDNTELSVSKVVRGFE